MACLRAADPRASLTSTLGPLEGSPEDPALFARLFEGRAAPVRPATCSVHDLARGGSLVFTHTAFPERDDAVAARLQPFVESAATIEVRAEAGDLLVIHNHRMLHGRRGFDDAERAFVRLLLWRREPYPAPAAWVERARGVARGRLA
jgi:hypothetical protein